MNRSMVILLAIAGLLLADGCSGKAPKKNKGGLKLHPEVSALGEVYMDPTTNLPYVRMATLDGAELNTGFTRLLNTFSVHLKRFNAVKKQLGETEDPAIKRELTQQLEKMLPTINQIKLRMNNAFGVSLDRGVPLVKIEKSHLYLRVGSNNTNTGMPAQTPTPAPTPTPSPTPTPATPALAPPPPAPVPAPTPAPTPAR